MSTKRGGINLIAWLRRGIAFWFKLSELIFFPSFCRLCSSLLQSPGEKIVCYSCLESLKPVRTSSCLRCGRFFETSQEPHLCSDCLKNPLPYSYHRSGGKYQGRLKDIILLYKYRKFKLLGKFLAQFVWQSLNRDQKLWAGAEVMVPVPIHPKKHKERGFNQAEILAIELAKLKGIDLEKKALVKVKNTLPQTRLTSKERAANVKGAFQLKGKERIKGKIILLIDDVYTTGSTIRECSLTLLEGGAREVRAVTVAQA